MKNLRFLLQVFFLLAWMAACNKSNEADYHPVTGQEIRIGALLPLSGSGSSQGTSMLAAIELGLEDITAHLGQSGTETRLILEPVDTKTDTAEALRQLESLFNRGIRLIVGPYSSAELSHIKNFADSHGVMIVSPSSVAVSLAIPGDNLFRFVTSDVLQGRAMCKMLEEDKVRVIVPLVRNDIWGNDLLNATAAGLAKAGAKVHPAVRYEPGTTGFGKVLDELDQAVADELEFHNANDIAVYLVSFSEGTEILSRAKTYAHLNNVYWYGSSAFALSPSVLNDTNAALFAYTHGLPCPLFGLDDAAKNKWEPLGARITAKTGKTPGVYSFAAYDALWVLVRASVAAGGQAPIGVLKSTFINEAANYFGATGNTLLDTNGDRASGNYDFWAVKTDSAGYCWKRVARYNSLSGTLTRQLN